VAAIVLGDDDAALQELLKEAYAVRIISLLLVHSDAGIGGQNIHVLQLNPHAQVPTALEQLSGSSDVRAALSLFEGFKANDVQEEKKRAERANKRLAERTIDAQRASAPVPRWTCIAQTTSMLGQLYLM
jgi:hypothetical protein